MSDLFDIETSLSPRLLWMQKHQAQVHYLEESEFNDAGWYAQGKRWGRTLLRQGETEDEALSELAKLMGVPLWNEEGGRP